MNKLLALTLLLLSGVVNAQTISFEIEPVTGCVDTNAPCQSPTSYSVYVAGSTSALVTSANHITGAVPFSMEIGAQYCFEATATNGEGESARSPQSCYTPQTSKPNAPVILSIPVTFTSGN